MIGDTNGRKNPVEITEKIESFDIDFFEGSLNELIGWLSDIDVTAHKDGYRDLYVDIWVDRDPGFYGTNDECSIRGTRDLTEKELAANKAERKLSRDNAKKIRECEEAKERAEYERLKGKFDATTR